MQYNLLFQNHLLLWNFLLDFRGGVADFLKASFSQVVNNATTLQEQKLIRKVLLTLYLLLFERIVSHEQQKKFPRRLASSPLMARASFFPNSDSEVTLVEPLRSPAFEQSSRGTCYIAVAARFQPDVLQENREEAEELNLVRSLWYL